MPLPNLSFASSASSGGDLFNNPNISADNSFSFGGASRTESNSGDGSLIKASTTSATKLPLIVGGVLGLAAIGFAIYKLS